MAGKPIGLALAVLAALSSGCKKSPTELLVVVDAPGYQVPRELGSVHVRVLSDQGGVASEARLQLEDGETMQTGLHHLPVSFGVAQKSDGAKTPVTVAIDGLDPSGSLLVARRAVVDSLIQGQILLLPIHLERQCERITCEDPETTCIDGRCQTDRIDSKSLATIRPGEELDGRSDAGVGAANQMQDASTAPANPAPGAAVDGGINPSRMEIRGTLTATPGGTSQLRATCMYSDDTALDCSGMSSWASGSPSVATVSSTGLVRAEALGSTVIAASAGSLTSTATFIVAAVTVTGVQISGTTTIGMGASFQLQVSCTFSDGMSRNCPSPVVWSSGAPSVATISQSGLLTALAQGTAVVTALAGGVKGTITLTVTAPMCTGTCGAPGCDTFTCIDLPPAGWFGPFQFYDGPAESVPQCAAPASNSALNVSADPVQEGAMCSLCSCVPPQSASCEASFALFGDPDCFSATQMTVTVFNGSCAAFGTQMAQAVAVNTDTHPRPFVQCGNPSPQTPTIHRIRWSHVGLGCTQPSPQEQGCAPGRVCIPKPPSPFEPRLCISADGDIPCPAATFVSKRVFYRGAADTRSCSPCSCHPNSDGCTDGVVSLYADVNCQNQRFQAPTSTPNCFAGQATYAAGSLSGSSLQNPRCDVGQSSPSGGITPTSPVTVCCTP